MKAMILAAGLGTRLLPFTEHLAKPLFPIAGRPLLGILIEKLYQAGCEAIVINTHHLHEQIESFIRNQPYPIRLITRYEPAILGTGGAIKNVSDFFDERPFMVINADIYTDIDFRQVYEFHASHSDIATLVLYDDPKVNTVCVGKDDGIIGFAPEVTTCHKRLTFTGIHVLNPEIIDSIPDGTFYSIIDAYAEVMKQGKTLRGFIPESCRWMDIGTPERYREALIHDLIPKAFQRAFGEAGSLEPQWTPLAGDGSDRKWFRLTIGNRSLILVDHGIQNPETESFVKIGTHLKTKGIQVPEIYLHEIFAGLVFVQDLGDDHFQTRIRQNNDQILLSYRKMIDPWIRFSIDGASGFDVKWTWQTAHYDRRLILEKECRYFVEAFLNNYLNISISFKDFEDEFSLLADEISIHAIYGLMHRDMQSRNIMVYRDGFYFIDFQGARIGPIQYDLASLLIDPYTNIPFSMRDQLLNECMDALSSRIELKPDSFLKGYRYCSVSRNLQMLGAFGYLSRVKQKKQFETYIPSAVKTLKHTLAGLSEFPKLKQFVLSEL